MGQGKQADIFFYGWLVPTSFEFQDIISWMVGGVDF